jgi:hypothetical protein
MAGWYGMQKISPSWDCIYKAIEKKIYNVKCLYLFEVLTAVLVTNRVANNASPIDSFRCFEDICCLHLQCQKP